MAEPFPVDMRVPRRAVCSAGTEGSEVITLVLLGEETLGVKGTTGGGGTWLGEALFAMHSVCEPSSSSVSSSAANGLVVL